MSIQKVNNELLSGDCIANGNATDGDRSAVATFEMITL